jgi:predicted dehydrogenase
MNTVLADPQTSPGYQTGQGQKSLGVAVVGLGRSGTFFHCRPLSVHPHYHIEGVFDIRSEVAERVANEFNCRRFDSWASILADPQVDLVVIALPTAMHHGHAMEAIAAGKSLLIEKPFAISSHEACEMRDAAQQAGVFLGAYHNRRFDGDVLSLKKILDSGVLGPVLKVSIHIHAYTRRHDWQMLREMGGGALANWGAHALDWCVHLFGKALDFRYGRLLQVLNPGNAEDSFQLVFETGHTSIEIEYLNFAARPLPKWHVVGQFGTAVGQNNEFQLRYCDPSRMRPLQVDASHASDGRYGVNEDLGWTETTVPWEDWDNCPAYLDSLHLFLTGDGPNPVPIEEVITELQLMEKIRSLPLNDLRAN